MTETIESWSKLVEKVSLLPGYDGGGKYPEGPVWIFRGQAAEHRLQTTLERNVKRLYYPESDTWEHETWSKLEDNILREFQRRAHHYLDRLPDREDDLEWLALVRHFGGPCRLLDWSYSAYIALFHTLKEGSWQEDWSRWQGVKLWAVDAAECRRQANRILGEPETKDAFGQKGTKASFLCFRRLLKGRRTPRRFVYPVNPFVLNERLTAQQGTFLCPSVLDESFHDLLQDQFPRHTDRYFKSFLVKPTSRLEFREFMRQFYRVGIDDASLFPGLEGFTKSLNSRMSLKWIKDSLHL